MRPLGDSTPSFAGGLRLAAGADWPRRMAAARPLPKRLVRRRRESIRRAARAVQKAVKPASNRATPEQKLVQRATMGMTPVEMAEVAELGYKGFLERQLRPDAIDDGGFEDALNSEFRSLEMTPFELNQSYGDDPVQPIIELIVATVLRLAYSPRQLFERTVMFWSDHFSIDVLAGHGYVLKPADHREVARAHAFGKFRDLVSASAHSPNMLEYLTNDTNVRGHPNENYARELMELHTMGVNGGYSQEDVREVARCFTGWTLYNVYDENRNMGKFRFDPFQHDEKRKRVLGRAIPGGQGEEDGEEVLDLLVAHRSTARFLATKLLRFFHGYEPRRQHVNRVAAKFTRTRGNLRATLRTVLSKKLMRKATPKIKRPQHLAVSALRGLGAEVVSPRFLFEQLELAGHLPYAWTPPDGYPDSAEYWSGYVLPRWNFASSLPFPDTSDVRLAAEFQDTSKSPRQLVKLLDERLMGGGMSKQTRIGLEEFLSAGPLTTKRLREAVGIAVASPEFQVY